MTLLKRILKRPGAQVMGAWLGAAYVRIVARTTRWDHRMPDSVRRLEAEGGSYIGVFWHGRLMMMHRAWIRTGKIHILVSEHRDGLLISRLIAHLGVPTLAGSTSKGGVAALRAMKRTLAAGDNIGITPDGPRGPRMRAKAGAIKLAQLSGCPIIPAAFSVTRRKILTSWDRFCLALPFARGVIIWGEPIRVPRGAGADQLEAHRVTLEDRLNALTAEADRLCGCRPVEPAPPAMRALPVADELADIDERAPAGTG